MFAKPVDERLNEVLKEEVFQKILEEGLSIQKKKPRKPYVPSKTKMSAIGLARHELEGVIYMVTPFATTMSGNERKNKFFEALDKRFLPFTMMQIERMEIETKELIVDAFLKDCKEKLQGLRDVWLDGPYMDNIRGLCVVTEEYYDRQRLKLLVEFGENCSVLKDEQYEEFEDALVKMLFTAAREKMRIQPRKEFKANAIERFWVDILKVVPFSGVAIMTLQGYYFDRLEKGMDEGEITEYKQLKVKPMEGFNFIDNTTGLPHTSSMHHYLVIAKSFSVARQLFPKEELEETVHHFVDFAHEMIKREKGDKPNSELITEKMAVNHVMEIIKHLPEVQRELKKD